MKNLKYLNASMTKFQVPVCKTVRAYGTVEMEASSFPEAQKKVQADIDENGLESLAAETEFTADWLNATDLSLCDHGLPDGRDPRQFP